MQRVLERMPAIVYAPIWLRWSRRRDELIIDHHARVADVGLTLVLFYLYEEAGGISYSSEVLDELLAMPQVVDIKMSTLDSVMTYQDVSRQFCAKHSDKLVITVKIVSWVIAFVVALARRSSVWDGGLIQIRA